MRKAPESTPGLSFRALVTGRSLAVFGLAAPRRLELLELVVEALADRGIVGPRPAAPALSATAPMRPTRSAPNEG